MADTWSGENQDEEDYDDEDEWNPVLQGGAGCTGVETTTPCQIAGEETKTAEVEVDEARMM